ncbi:MAG: hypothetical protein A07HR60_01470 [uncultured archaeon A07HR60]|nr:MAG: hypothetical protein J07HR59_01597 [Halorubrum sp. J07HR59]ESS11415.1 MAG: hypothetical protein A07HR60_01470 [uncultured archaeon A07HR60]
MKEYKMRPGEYFDDRVPDLKELMEENFGSVTGSEAREGNELYVVSEPDNPVFDRILAGKSAYDSKKDRLLVEFQERDAEELIAEGEVDAAADAVDLKNDFLKTVTARDAKARRDSMKRDVEDEAPNY